jgi:hypothetical protein
VAAYIWSISHRTAENRLTSEPNRSGQIVGLYLDSAGQQHGFELSGGVSTSIDFPGAVGTQALGVNTIGEAVGLYQDTAGQHCFSLAGGVYSPIDFPGATYTSVEDINSAGEIVGSYGDSAGHDHGFLPLRSLMSLTTVSLAPGKSMVVNVPPASWRNQQIRQGRALRASRTCRHIQKSLDQRGMQLRFPNLALRAIHEVLARVGRKGRSKHAGIS